MTRSALKGLLYTGVVAVVVGAAAPWVIPLLFGEDFDPAAKPLALLLPGVVAYAPVTVLVVYLSVRHSRPHLSLVVSIAAAVVTAALAVGLIPRYGVEGAAVASARRLRRRSRARVGALPARRQGGALTRLREPGSGLDSQQTDMSKCVDSRPDPRARRGAH